MKKLRVLVLVHPDLMPPESSKGYTEQEINEWKTEYDVVTTLRRAGHEVRPLGVHDELKPIRDEIESWKPDVVSRCWSSFAARRSTTRSRQLSRADARALYRLQSARPDAGARQGSVEDTGALSSHSGAGFAVFRSAARSGGRRGWHAADRQERQRGRLLRHLPSLGGRHDDKLAERVNFIHERIGTAAIAEQYIEGREIYVGVVGNERLIVLPVWELQFRNMARGRLADSDREGQARSRLSGAPRHPSRPGQGSHAGTRRPHPGHGQADLPDAGARRLCPHRFPSGRRRHAVFSRSQSQSRNRRKPGIRHRGEARRHQISRSAAPIVALGIRRGLGIRGVE